MIILVDVRSLVNIVGSLEIYLQDKNVVCTLREIVQFMLDKDRAMIFAMRGSGWLYAKVLRITFKFFELLNQLCQVRTTFLLEIS